MKPSRYIILTLSLCVAHSFTGQLCCVAQETIPASPYEAEQWLITENNSVKKNELGQVVEVILDYVPAMFVVGDLEVFPHLETLTINYTSRFYDRHMTGIARLVNLKKFQVLHSERVTEVSLSMLHYCPKMEEVVLVEAEGIHSLAALSNCKTLKKLRLSEMGHFELKNLRRLNNLANIESLNLSNNKDLEDADLMWLGEAAQLKELNLNSCVDLTDQGLVKIGALKNLKKLELKTCKKITGSFLGDLNPEVEYLDLENCQLTDDSAKHFSSLTRLKYLSLSQNIKLSEESFEKLGDCHQLEELKLVSTQVGDGLFERLAPMQTLIKLNVSKCDKVTGFGVGQLANCSKLRNLVMMECGRINSPDLEPIGKLTSIKFLRLNETRIRSDGFKYLKNLNNLEDVSFNGCKWVDDAALKEICELPGVKRLYLNRCARPSDVGIGYLAQLPKLEVFQISQNRKVTGMGLKEFSPDCGLRGIRFENCEKLSPEGLAQVARLRNIERLVLLKQKLTNDHIFALFGMPSLRSYQFDSTKGTTGGVVTRFRNSLPSYGKPTKKKLVVW